MIQILFLGIVKRFQAEKEFASDSNSILVCQAWEDLMLWQMLHSLC